MKRPALPSPRDALLVLWVALLGADRINLLDGIVPFIMTPFLALTPVVALSENGREAPTFCLPATGASTCCCSCSSSTPMSASSG